MDTVNELIARDLALGTLAKEAVECSETNKNMAALACLFVLVEQVIKFALGRTKGSFYLLLKVAKERELISSEEFATINELRRLRNKLFHETHYAWFYEKSGAVYPFSEDEAKKEIFNDFSDRCFVIALKLLEQA